MFVDILRLLKYKNGDQKREFSAYPGPSPSKNGKINCKNGDYFKKRGNKIKKREIEGGVYT